MFLPSRRRLARPLQVWEKWQGAVNHGKEDAGDHLSLECASFRLCLLLPRSSATQSSNCFFRIVSPRAILSLSSKTASERSSVIQPLTSQSHQIISSAELEKKLTRNHLTRSKMPSRLLQVLNKDNGRRLWTKSWPPSRQPNDLWHTRSRTVFKSFEPQNCSLYFSICQEL